jgi:hypothetical protein
MKIIIWIFVDLFCNLELDGKFQIWHLFRWIHKFYVFSIKVLPKFIKFIHLRCAKENISSNEKEKHHLVDTIRKTGYLFSTIC